MQIDARLREASFGIWEGMSFSDVYRHHLQQFNCWYQDIWKYKMPGGENFTEVWERVSLAIQDITRQDYGSVLVVTHGGVVKALLGKIDPSLDIWKTAIDPGSMTIIRYERGFTPFRIQAWCLAVIKLSSSFALSANSGYSTNS